MRQNEIIAKLKDGAYIAAHYSASNTIVYLNCNTRSNDHEKREQYRITHRQVQMLCVKGIIEENPEQSKVSRDKYGNAWISRFYYLAKVLSTPKGCDENA